MIRPLKRNDISAIVAIHRRELPGFLSELGVGFLKNFYLASLLLPSVFTFVIYEENKLVGFVTGTQWSKGLLKAMLKTSPLQFLYHILMHFITHPYNVWKLFKILTYPGFLNDHAELLTICVDRRYHKRGVGKQLLGTVLQEFKKWNVSGFMVSVYDRLPANGFYKNMGFRFMRSFDFLGEKMNYYEYKIH